MKPPIEFVKKDNNKNVIVFIHGFTSDSNTWTNSGGLALPEMLLEEGFVAENFDVGYFNYFTKLVDFKKARLTTGLIRTIFGSASRTKKI